jgi:1-acyl-sn-glycerol-3-phosphate acyltransferase
MHNFGLSVIAGLLKRSFDLFVTLLIWIYFIFGFLIFFSPFYVIVLLFARNREVSFQKLNSIYFKSFFLLLRTVVPGLKWSISEQIRSIRSSVIVCNHLSYLDPILLTSLFPMQKTIVKGIFFKVPIFGTILKVSGYIPASKNGAISSWMIDKMEDMQEYLDSGGNLFIFPEGTRSRNNRIGEFQEGAFKLAKRFKAPIRVLYLKGTNEIYRPGRFLFYALKRVTIQIRLIGNLEPDYNRETVLISNLVKTVHTLYEKEQRKGH